MERLLTCVTADLADMAVTDRQTTDSGSKKQSAGQLTVAAVGRLSTIRQRLPPLTFLPCGVRPADPSPPSSPTAQTDHAVVPERALTGRVERLADRYVITETLGRGTFGSVLRAECRRTGRPTALKKLPKASTKPADFRREFDYGLQLSRALPAAIVATFDDAFETETSYVFAQELAPCGDLLAAVTPPHRGGLGETRCKRVAGQLAAALAFLHAHRIVHRDVKPENVMLYDPGCRLVKLGDFGVARRCGTVVCRICPGTAYTAPEVCSRQLGQTYRVDPATDVWAFGIVLFALMTGNFPWRVAARRDTDDDRLFAEFTSWQEERRRPSVSGPGVSVVPAPPPPSPEPWSRFTETLTSLLHRLLAVHPSRRAGVDVIDRPTLESPWTVRRSDPVERRRTCPGAEPGRRAAAAARRQSAAGEPAARDALMDPESRSDRVSNWLLQNGQINSANSVS